MQLNGLNDKQVDILVAMSKGVKTAMRFFTSGHNVNIVTGSLASRGSNVLYHTVYWDLSPTAAKAAIEMLKENNSGLNFTFVNNY